MLAAVFIAAGYAALVWEFGLLGVAAILAHVLIMLVAARLQKGGTRGRLIGVRGANERGLIMTTKHRAAQRAYCADPPAPPPAPAAPTTPAPASAPPPGPAGQ